MTPVANEPSPAPSSPEILALAERARKIRQNALQTRLVLAAQRENLDRIALRLAQARGSVRKEAAAVSAPVAASLRAEASPRRRNAAALYVGPVLRAALPFAVIGAAAWLAHAQVASRLTQPAAVAFDAPAFAAGRDSLVHLVPPPPLSEELDPAADALTLVQGWRPDAEGPSLLERLGGELDRPGLPPAWSVERTGPRHFIVRFRDGNVEHAFEADLEARLVSPAADAETLLSAR